MEPCKIDNAEIILNEIPSVNAVVGDGSPEKSDDEPPTYNCVVYLKCSTRKSFLRLWKKIPAYLRAIHFDLKRIFGPQLILMI